MSFQFLLPGLPLISLLCFLSVLVVDKIQPSLANPELYENCSHPFRCGKLTAGYPFSGGDRPLVCGHPLFQLKCEKETPTMTIANVTYRVLKVNPKEQVVKLTRQEYFEGLCPQKNTSIDRSLFDISDGYELFNLIYGCPVFPGRFTCSMKDVTNYMDGFVQFTSGIMLRRDCNTTVTVLFSKATKTGKLGLQRALEEGFEMKWKLFGCEESCSSCGFDPLLLKGVCYCPNGQPNSSLTGCSNSKGTLASSSVFSCSAIRN